MQVQPLSWEYPLEAEMATHFSIFAWEILWMRSLVDCQTSWIQLSTIAVAVVQCQHWCLQALLWKISSSLLAGASSIHQGACSSRTCQTCNQPCWGPATHQSICHKSRRQGQPARAGTSHAYYPTHGSWLYQSPRGNAADLGDTARRPGPAGQRGAQRLTQGTAT